MSLDDLISNLGMAQFCFPLKSSIVSFVNNVYFDIEKDVADEDMAKMHTIITHFNNDFEMFHKLQESLNRETNESASQIPTEQNLDEIEVDIT